MEPRIKPRIHKLLYGNGIPLKRGSFKKLRIRHKAFLRLRVARIQSSHPQTFRTNYQKDCDLRGGGKDGKRRTAKPVDVRHEPRSTGSMPAKADSWRRSSVSSPRFLRTSSGNPVRRPQTWRMRAGVAKAALRTAAQSLRLMAVTVGDMIPWFGEPARTNKKDAPLGASSFYLSDPACWLARS